MQLLILGGTSFVGRAIVEAAIAAGHGVTLFNRGKTNPDLFGEAEKLRGDRDSGDYDSLAGGTWDATVDVNGYVPRHVDESSAALGDRAGRYLFISTGSVYSMEGLATAGEEAERHEPETGTEEITNDTYGPLKVACENAVEAAYGEQSTIVRPGIVGGPHDPTDRFTYWVRRAAEGGELLAPNRPDQPVQVVDARDLGTFVVRLLEDDTAGMFNGVGPDESTSLASMIEACVAAAGSDVAVTWVDPGFLSEREAPMLPLFLPESFGVDGLFRRSTAAADAAGMTHRPLVETARDTLAWDRERGEPAMAGTLDRATEAKLLEAWHADH